MAPRLIPSLLLGRVFLLPATGRWRRRIEDGRDVLPNDRSIPGASEGPGESDTGIPRGRCGSRNAGFGLSQNRPRAAFVPARKPGKLPYDTIGVEYALEYGTNRLEMHTDAIQPGQKVLIVDDLLATGGTAKATLELVQKLKGEVVGCCFVIELSFLDGAAGLGDVPIQSLVHY